jgi:hypothetical protein
MTYQVRPEDYGMTYGDRPFVRIKLKMGPEPTPRRVNPTQVTSEYDTRAAARGGRSQQFTKSGMMAMDGSGMEGVEMMESVGNPNSGVAGGIGMGGGVGVVAGGVVAGGGGGGYGTPASKKNTRTTGSSKDVRMQQGHTSAQQSIMSGGSTMMSGGSNVSSMSSSSPSPSSSSQHQQGMLSGRSAGGMMMMGGGQSGMIGAPGMSATNGPQQHHHQQQHSQQISRGMGMVGGGVVGGSGSVGISQHSQPHHPGNHSSPGMMVSSPYNRGGGGPIHQGMMPPGSSGSPGVAVAGNHYNLQSSSSNLPGTPYGGGSSSHQHQQTPMTPSSTPYIQRNLRAALESSSSSPMTPGAHHPNGSSMVGGGSHGIPSAPGTPFFSGSAVGDESSLPGGMDDTGSALNSDDEDDGDKSKKNKRGKPKNRANRKKDDADGDLFGDEDPQTAGYHAAVQIWKTVEAYFADFTEEDFKLVAVDGKDDSFRIPNLGKKSAIAHLHSNSSSSLSSMHGSPMSTQQSQQHHHHASSHHPSSLTSTPSQGSLLTSTSEMMDIVPKVDGGGLFAGPNGPNFMTRLMSCLIEETSISSVPQFLNNRPPLMDVSMSPMEQDQMFGIVSQQEAEFIESRLKKELTLLGLFGDIEASPPPSQQHLSNNQSSSGGGGGGGSGQISSSPPYSSGSANNANNASNFKETRSSTAAAKEQAAAAAAAAAHEKDVDDDDEVLSELKRLQSQLRTKLDTNNAMKILLRQQMDAANGARKKAKDERDHIAKLDASYVSQHKAILKKKKKPTAKQAAAAAAKAAKANTSKANNVKQEGASS